MPDELPEALRAYLHAFETGDVSTLERWVAADVDHLQVGDDGDPATEKAMVQGLGLAGVKAVIEGLHELMRDLRVVWRLRARSVLQLYDRARSQLDRRGSTRMSVRHS